MVAKFRHISELIIDVEMFCTDIMLLLELIFCYGSPEYSPLKEMLSSDAKLICLCCYDEAIS